MAVFNDLSYFRIDLIRNLRGCIGWRIVISSQENGVIAGIVLDRAKVRHTIGRDHILGDPCRLLDITRCASRNVIKEDLFGSSSAHVARDRVQQVLAGV